MIISKTSTQHCISGGSVKTWATCSWTACERTERRGSSQRGKGLGANHVQKRTNLRQRHADHPRGSTAGPSSSAADSGCRSLCPCSRRGRHSGPPDGPWDRRASHRCTRWSGPAERFATCADICIAGHTDQICMFTLAALGDKC